jgi:hypothetical protein
VAVYPDRIGCRKLNFSFLIRRQALPRIADYLGTQIVFSVDITLILAESRRLVIIRNISGNRSQCRQRAMKLSCVFCNGLGRQVGDFDLMCPICEGHGSLEIAGNPSLHRCHFCHGYGREVGTFGPSCPICKGFGQLTEDRKPPTLSKSNPPAEPVPPSGLTLIADSRLAELRTCAHSQLDYRKLIRLCDEFNTTFSQGCYLAVIMLTRSLLDHVPPVFGKSTFSEVANNHGGKSLKDAMQFLDGAARKIADGQLHGLMRKTETLPVRQQVDFAALLDLLLAEIVRITR